MGRLTFIMFLVFSLPVGMHHLFADPEYGAAWKFLQSFLTFFVALPTLLTVFSISASLEIAGRHRGGRGLLGWIGALPWDEPMVLATALSLVMLGLGGFGGVINMSYAMNSMIHNTSWVPAHFHMIFGGAVVIMYFVIAYEMWPRITGKPLRSKELARWQLWLWFWGMMIVSIPWIAGRAAARCCHRLQRSIRCPNGYVDHHIGHRRRDPAPLCDPANRDLSAVALR
jgi:cytochrome c oxidase subunit 1